MTGKVKSASARNPSALRAGLPVEGRGPKKAVQRRQPATSPSFEPSAKFKILEEDNRDFTMEHGELTPT